MNRRPGISFRPLVLYLVLLGTFLAGAVADRSGWLPGLNDRPPPGVARTFGTFWEVWHLVQDYYVDREAVQPPRMTRGAIEGMLDSLGDVGHTTYLTADELKQMESRLAGEMEGIGATLTVRQRRPTVMSVLPHSPAQAAGLRAGDIILQVNGKEVGNLGLEQIVDQVRGPAGTEVTLRIHREGAGKPLDFTITRAKVEVPTLTWHVLPGEPIAHLAVHDFGTQTDAQLRDALKQLREQGINGLVVDVRGNPGGLKNQAVAVTSEFLSAGDVFLEQDAKGHRKPVPVKPGGEATEIPVVVLIDEGTASSSEIFAGALQDHGRAKLVGTQTFGAGTVLEPFELSDGSAVFLAVAEWFTPNGRPIWHRGITPDVEVTLPEGASVLLPEAEGELDASALARSEDKQFLKALELLREELGKGKGKLATKKQP